MADFNCHNFEGRSSVATIFSMKVEVDALFTGRRKNFVLLLLLLPLPPSSPALICEPSTRIVNGKRGKGDRWMDGLRGCGSSRGVCCLTMF
jgi:hypothetical protein